MAMHFANNGTIVFLYYLNNIDAINIDVENFGKTNIIVTLLSIVVTITLFWLAAHFHNKDIKTENTEI